MGSVAQRVKAAFEEGFHPMANGLFMLTQMTRDFRNAPAQSAEAHQFQTVTGTGRNIFLMRPLMQFLLLFFGQTDTIPMWRPSTYQYELLRNNYAGVLSANIELIPNDTDDDLDAHNGRGRLT